MAKIITPHELQAYFDRHPLHEIKCYMRDGYDLSATFTGVKALPYNNSIEFSNGKNKLTIIQVMAVIVKESPLTAYYGGEFAAGVFTIAYFTGYDRPGICNFSFTCSS